MSKIESEDSEEDEETADQKELRDDRFKSSKAYVPPKLSAVHYSEFQS